MRPGRRLPPGNQDKEARDGTLGTLVAPDGLAFVGLWIGTLAAIGNDVASGDSDAKILAYYAKSGNRDRHTIAFVLSLAATLFFVWFLAKLRERLVRSEGGAGTLTALAYGAGIAAAALWTVGNAFFASVALTRGDTSKFQLDPNTYRILSDTGYAIWFSGTTVAALTVAATAVLSLRSGLLPRWIAWLSFPVALTMLVSFFFIPFLILLGWLIVVSLTLIVRKEATATTAA
jgi:hypothetical protein